MNVVGLDIGGANIKASNGLDLTFSISFPLWQQPGQLASAIQQLLLQFPSESILALTMTGELADCFETRAQGVQTILAAAEEAAAGKRVHVWQTCGEFVTPEEALEFPELSAAGNWHALATWAGRMAPQGSSLLVDIGSTTTDIIPLEDGIPMPEGRTDLERLQSGELLYLGVKRTPIGSLSAHGILNGNEIGIARELFATTYDVHLWLSHLPERPHDCSTANGRPATRQAAAVRLARMICSDLNDLNDEHIQELAESFHQQELSLLESSLQQVSARILARGESPRCVLLTGEGEFLIHQYLQQTGKPTKYWPGAEIISLTQSLGPAHSEGACAFALARLGLERFAQDLEI